MLAHDINQVLRRVPFQPFRIHMSNGQSFVVRHPELAVVGTSSVFIGFPSAEDEHPVYERFEILSIFNINRLEPVPATPAAASN